MSTATSSACVPCSPAPDRPRDDAGDQAEAEARRWIERHHDDLVRLTRHVFRRRRPEVREEAVAETLARTFHAAIGAARRGRLHRLTPATCVCFAARQFRGGRRFAGSSSTCAMAEATQRRRGVRVVSLDAPLDPEHRRGTSFAAALADDDAESPLEQVRRRHDYPAILRRERVSVKARRTFAFLAETRGAGRQLDLAATLMVSPGRITQLKRELADALSRGGYRGPLGRRCC